MVFHFHLFWNPSIFLIIYALVQANCQLTHLANTNRAESNEPKSYKQVLDPATDLSLSWTVNQNNGTLTFTIESSHTGGYIALALTKQGILEGGDVIAVGVNGGNGTPFVLDMHGVDNGTIASDESQDWRLVNDGQSRNSGFRITIQRAIDTCDSQDLPIGEELRTVLYGYGFGTVGSTFEPEGRRKIYFIHPSILPESSNVNAEGFQRWRISRRYELVPRTTSYWCSIHKMEPSLQQKHQFVGSDIYFGDESARRYLHHQQLYRCYVPPGADADKLYEPFLDYAGEECYVNDSPRLPVGYCIEAVGAWAIGGEGTRYPETLGIPVGLSGGNEYFMLESHYNNVNKTTGVTIETGFDMYYTPELRRDDGTLMYVGHGPLGTFIVPPNTSNFNVAGHCSKECSLQMIPTGGLDIVVTMLHGHTSSRKIRFRHFRGENELPWIIKDDEYDFEYQPFRNLESPRRVMPGDQLTVECEYDTTWKNGSAVASGFSTGDEMCVAYTIINKALPSVLCTSEYNTDRTMEKYGIRNMTWDINLHERVINDASNPEIIGLTLSQLVERENWTPERTRQLEREQMYSNHAANCLNTRLTGGIYHYGLLFQNLTGGVIPLPLLDQGSPNKNAVRTPYPLPFPVGYPRGSVYTPSPSTCSPLSTSNPPEPQSNDNTISKHIPVSVGDLHALVTK